MKKKNYLEPKMTVHRVESAVILAGSDSQASTKNLNLDEDDYEF